ncbi:MAG: DUF2911 domain-containing protein [Myxococcota bacterium]|nr:DUF2911 domain-containing protein [Myxococcota bacterium]
MHRARFLSLVLLVGGAAACADPAAPRETQTETPSAAAEPAAAAVPAPPQVVFARQPSETPPIQSQPVLPQPSVRAAVEQTVGVTNLRVDYSSPAARGRTIFGELLPYGELWRAGANAATRLELSSDVTIFGAAVPAGAYSIFMIPGETEWTVILNRDSQGRGYSGHDESEDVARGTVTPSDAPPRERLAYTFDDTTETSTNLVLDWAGKRVAIPIEVATAELVQANIDAVLEQAWRPHFNAGRYLLEQEGQQARALELLERSQQIQATWWNEWWLARALAANDRQADAVAHAERALELGAGQQVFDENFAAQVRASLEEWR